MKEKLGSLVYPSTTTYLNIEGSSPVQQRSFVMPLNMIAKRMVEGCVKTKHFCEIVILGRIKLKGPVTVVTHVLNGNLHDDVPFGDRVSPVNPATCPFLIKDWNKLLEPISLQRGGTGPEISFVARSTVVERTRIFYKDENL